MIEKYKTYSVEDYLADEKFIDWVNSPDREADAFWAGIIAAYPAQKQTIRQAKQITRQLSEAASSPVDKSDVREIWQQIDTKIATHRPAGRQQPMPRSLWLTAASVILMLGLGWAIYDSAVSEKALGYEKLVRTAENPLKEVTNTGAKTLAVTLPDGSRVFLATNSKLSYSKDFTQKTRDVYLSGAAFFDVSKNPEKPFIVYANELVTKVLGTSFSIKAFDTDSRVTVAVKTGRVSVFANRHRADVDPETKGIILIPNQQADFQRENETISRSLIEQPKIVIAKKELEKFAFNNAPVTEIFEAMESAYGVDFLFDPEILSSCRLTTSLSEETLFERLDVICEAIGASYKVVDAQIVISGRKCN
ncbi:FecR family protein [Dyadobacter aurulentus]|uniref:FecR family protein n=1 Tax=Dyadobacter sp. UC 10 TaxID=2605428 RepID=UPI0011F35F8E|nr:FecR family protein [Dyadobacter sp. UC 10]KAA0992796.1 DUF4974 domain-containing protein [Dyadobacter sp. UC 10]